MTVCIAALCENGAKIVTASDGMLSYGGITADVLLAKMTWMNDWQFLYAGSPSSVELIFEEIKRSAPLTRETLIESVRTAYDKRLARWCTDAVLAPYDLSMAEFRSDGLRMFGEAKFNQLANSIEQSASEFCDQLLVCGWGKSPLSAMIFEVGRYSSRLHSQSGMAAIGSGCEVALSNLLLLGHARHSDLSAAIYSVAAAKFAAEKSNDRLVGESTTIFVSWKRCESEVGPPTGSFVDQEHIAELRQLWERFGRPKMPFMEVYELLRPLELELNGRPPNEIPVPIKISR